MASLTDEQILKDELLKLSKKIKETRDNISSEEQTKMAYIIPMLRTLGYDITNPFEIVAEYTSDFGIKQGEKVDFTIIINDEPTIIIEAKDCHKQLNMKCVSQLYRYFSVTPSKLAILTNGIEYRFFSDTIKQNVMDEKPLMVIDLLSIKDSDVDFLLRLRKKSVVKNGIVLQDNKALFTERLYQWVDRQKSSVDYGFIDYLKDTLSVQLSDSEIRSIVSDVFSKLESGCEMQRTGASTPKKATAVGDSFMTGASLQTGVSDTKVDNSVETVDKSKQSNKSVKPKNNGITAVLNIMDKNFNYTGCNLVFVMFDSTIYKIRNFYKLYDAFIDYVMDRCGWTRQDVVNCEMNRSYDIFALEARNLRAEKEHNGIFYSANINASGVVRHIKALCSEIKDCTAYIGLMSKSDYAEFMDTAPDVDDNMLFNYVVSSESAIKNFLKDYNPFSTAEVSDIVARANIIKG